MQLQQEGNIVRSLLMTVLNQGALTPFCYHENYFTLRGIRILMADHCYDVASGVVVLDEEDWCPISKVRLGTVLYYPVRGNERDAWQTWTVSSVKWK